MVKVCLSSVIAQQHSSKPEILRLTDCDVTHIDIIQCTLSKVFTSLFMSRNSITTLINIEQFENLCVLSVSHNFIRYLDDIQPLSRLHSLKKLSLSGNAVTHMPFYKVHVLVICPHLEQLDELKVDPADYKLAKQMHARAKVSYDQLQVNQLRNCLLTHLSELMACHSEMRRTVFGTFRCEINKRLQTSSNLLFSADILCNLILALIPEHNRCSTMEIPRAILVTWCCARPRRGECSTGYK
jgi:hypothetical protein